MARVEAVCIVALSAILKLETFRAMCDNVTVLNLDPNVLLGYRFNASLIFQGIPTVQDEAAPADQGSETTPASGGDTAGNPLAFLQTQPQFALIRQAVQQNPALLPTLLQELGQSNPQLLQVRSTLYYL